MADTGFGEIIGPASVLMGAAVVAVPLFRHLGLGSVLGYFAAGALVGPSVFRFFTDTSTILHFSELGVVMFLFVIGLEPSPAARAIAETFAPGSNVSAISRAFSSSGQSRGLRLDRTGVAVKTSKARA